MSSNTPEERDRQWMQHALHLAERSVGLSSPNPAVGCVLVQGDQIVGEGFHEYDKRDHAEVAALKQAGDRARGATAYITLEPCSHRGRTGPCADALLVAGVARVVIATRDPNPLVHGAGRGEGIERLRAAGVAVETGVLESPARRLNDAFARHIRTSLPLVTLKIASTLDGRIAPQSPTKPPFCITGAAARDEVQKMRHAADAVLTGVGTVLADDPLLTDRSNLPRRRRLLRVVLDSTLRTPLDSQLVATAHDDLLVFFTRADAGTQKALEARGVHLVQLGEDAERHVPLAQAIKHLGAMELISVLVEGGSEINAAVLNGNLADRLMLFYAPTMLGGDAVPMVASKIRQQTVQDFTLRRFGEDYALDARLRILGQEWIETMFTGLIETTGSVLSVEERRGSRRIAIAAPGINLRTGDSIAVSGVCLTAVDLEPEAARFHADLSAETVARTSLALLAPGSTVNLETPTAAGTPLGGHVVQGHVDGTGTLVSLTPVDAQASTPLTDWRMQVAVPASLGRYMVEKGSVAIEGISLTIARWEPEAGESGVIEIAIIPHTYARTNLHTLVAGQPLNLEADVMLKFFEQRQRATGFELTLEYLIANGY